MLGLSTYIDKPMEDDCVIVKVYCNVMIAEFIHLYNSSSVSQND